MTGAVSNIILYNLRIVAILLADTGKSLKFYRFESIQFSFFSDLKFILLRLILILFFFTAEAGIILNLFLNFVQK